MLSSARSLTPVTENAVIDFAIDIDLYNWAENNAPYLDGGEDTADNRLHFDNVQDFLDFYDGLHPREHPGMDNYRRDMERKAHRGDRSAKARSSATISWQIRLTGMCTLIGYTRANTRRLAL